VPAVQGWGYDQKLHCVTCACDVKTYTRPASSGALMLTHVRPVPYYPPHTDNAPAATDPHRIPIAEDQQRAVSGANPWRGCLL